MIKNWLKRFKNTKIKIWQYFIDWWEPCWQKKFNLRKKKVQNQMFMDSIKFYWRFNWIYGEFDCNINWFWSQFGLQLEEIKVLGSNYNFWKLIWSNQGLNCINIEVWWPIKDLIEEIWNQGLKWKRRVNRGV
jgi:hypothetical protein